MRCTWPHRSGPPICACCSKASKGIPVTDALFDRTIDKLLKTQGHDINRAYHHRSYARSAPRVRGLKKA